MLWKLSRLWAQARRLQQKLSGSCERQVLVCGCHYARDARVCGCHYARDGRNLQLDAEAIDHDHNVMVAAPGDGEGTAGTNRPAVEGTLLAAGAEGTGAELALTLPNPMQATNTVTTSPRMLYRQRRGTSMCCVRQMLQGLAWQ